MHPPLLHHIAIATTNLGEMADFYSRLPNMNPIPKKDHFGQIRSIWFQFHPNILLMLEKKPANRGPEALVFSLLDKEGKVLEFFEKPKIVERTDYTFYLLDPDGNKIGYSTYPNPIENYLHKSFFN